MSEIQTAELCSKPTQESDKPIVRFSHISKQFPGIKALEDISFDIRRGEVHCLLGENGAGKSTLMKILTGVYHADEGDIFIDGEKVVITNIVQAQKLKIGTVFQENSLIPHLTVAENVFLTREIKNSVGLINWPRTYSECARWCGELGVELDPKARVNKLSVAQQQIVEIVKMFSQNPHIVILDEPTSALSDHEIDNLFNIVKKMQAKGITFIYISHRMEEIKRIGDRGTVLRDGKLVANIEDIRTFDMEKIISLIVGRTLNEKFPARHAIIGNVLMEVKDLCVPHLIYDISFSVRKGEVLGFAGLIGSGRTTTAKAVFGAIHRSAGRVFMNGKEIHIHHPNDAIKNGIGLLPENRKEEGLILKRSVAWNIIFSNLRAYKKGPFIDRRKEMCNSADYKERLSIKTPSLERPVNSLSGGNQQKVVFAKWLCAKSKVYIFDEPTRGIDVGAKSEIYGIINMLAAEGNAVIVISSELPEILGVCDTVAVFHEGRLRGILDRSESTQEAIMRLAMGGK